jgi:hypothetical protein
MKIINKTIFKIKNLKLNNNNFVKILKKNIVQFGKILIMKFMILMKKYKEDVDIHHVFTKILFIRLGDVICIIKKGIPDNVFLKYSNLILTIAL